MNPAAVFHQFQVSLVTEGRLPDYNKLRSLSGSREPSPSYTGLGPPGFDPGYSNHREAALPNKRAASNSND